MEQAVALFGSFDENIKLIEREYSVSIVGRESELKISGDIEAVDKASKVIESLLMLINRGEPLSEQNIRYCISLINEGSKEKIETLNVSILKTGKMYNSIVRMLNQRVNSFPTKAVAKLFGFKEQPML